jgi:histidinol phosphatase-like PHP family hydrolase
MRNEFIAITEHSRDADTENAVRGMTEWFVGMYLSNNEWLKENYLKNKDELADSELEEIKGLAKTRAEEVAKYGDERIEEILNDIENSSETSGIKVFKGIEVSLMPGGNLDTEMVEQGKFDMVNCSIHPDVDKKLFEPIINDPDKYTDLILLGTKNKKVNILSHIGSETNDGVFENIRWDEIAESAILNKVAIEINLKKLITFIYKEILDYDKYPKNDNLYQSVLKTKLKELIPIISSEKIKKKIEPYFSQGLKIAINTDEHKNKFIKSKTDKNGTEFNFIPRDMRYWRCMKIVEKYFNDAFKELGIKKENIINTFNVEELKDFFAK